MCIENIFLDNDMLFLICNNIILTQFYLFIALFFYRNIARKDVVFGEGFFEVEFV
jgi:hypothetical protein